MGCFPASFRCLDYAAISEAGLSSQMTVQIVIMTLHFICLCLSGVPVAPNAGPFAPPVNYGPPPNPGPVNYRPPPTVVQQYYGPPPNVMQTNYGPPPNIAPPPNFAPPTNFALPPNFVPPPNIGPPPQPFMSPVNSYVPPPQGNSNFGFGSFAQPQPQAPAVPAVRPAASTADLNQPIPHEAQYAASGYSQTVGNVEHEFEATGNGHGGIETSHSNHPPPSSCKYFKCWWPQ